MDVRERVTALVRWVVLGSLVGVLCGLASAAFLWLLDLATSWRQAHEVVVYALPVAGVLIGLVYQRFGAAIAGGNNLVIDTIHDEGPTLPLRMAPMVLVGTVLTHLFGGSAGREGTAVQMGASLTDALARLLKLKGDLRVQLLAAGVAGGFGSVFGTPIAGAIFGLEFVVLGRVEYAALIPAVVASVVGDVVTRAVGITHTRYPTVSRLEVDAAVLGKWLVFGVAVAAVTWVFIELTHWLKARGARLALPWRMAVGGVVVVALWRLVGTDAYLGLGVPGIVRAFSDPSLPVEAFALKLLFTAVTLGAGFLGGEVTPLFFVGASLGSVLARALGLPLELGAAVGMAATFGASSNTPVALSVMAAELVGANAFPHVLLVSAVAYVLTGQRSIYTSQRVTHRKHGGALTGPTRLKDL